MKKDSFFFRSRARRQRAMHCNARGNFAALASVLKRELSLKASKSVNTQFQRRLCALPAARIVC